MEDWCSAAPPAVACAVGSVAGDPPGLGSSRGMALVESGTSVVLTTNSSRLSRSEAAKMPWMWKSKAPKLAQPLGAWQFSAMKATSRAGTTMPSALQTVGQAVASRGGQYSLL